MGREVRRVPANWVHPTDEVGSAIPLCDGLAGHTARWDERDAKWREGLRDDYCGGWKAIEDNYREKYPTYADWDGPRPDPAGYMPDWPDSQRTHFQMYETCTEGTPISPVMATAEELARWLADNGASSFGTRTATYEQWLAVCRNGGAVSAMYTPGTGLISGVEAMGTGKP